MSLVDYYKLISALATVGTLGQIIYTIINDKKGGMLSYVLSSIIVVVGFTLYKIALIAYCKVSKLVKGRKKNICKKKNRGIEKSPRMG